MNRWMLFVGAALLAAVALRAGPALAENEGLDDLNKAMERKLVAEKLGDLGEVIRLAENALKQGLDRENTTFAENLLASALYERGAAVADMIFDASPPNSRWPQFRHIALKDLERANELQPGQIDVLKLIAKLNLLPDGDTQRAAKALEQALEAATEGKQRAEILVLRASLYEDPAKKLASLKEAIEADPDNPAPHRGRAAALAMEEKFDEAIEAFDAALRLDPTHVATYEAKALVLTRAKRFDEAIAALDRALELEPENLELRIQKARVYVEKEDRDAALATLDRMLEDVPDNVTLLLLRASLHDEAGNAEKALADVDRALELEPDRIAAVRLRAMLLAGADRFDEAIAAMETLRGDAGNDMLVQLQLAMLYTAADKYDQALKTFNAVLAEDPDNTLALHGRADVLLNVGRQAEAIADYEKCIKLDVADSAVLNNLAWVLATSPNDQLRDGKRAIELAAKAAELTEFKKPHILSTLAAAYAETGDFAKARQWSEKALEIAGDDDREPLAKELESYRAGKPWRELLSDGEAVEP